MQTRSSTRPKADDLDDQTRKELKAIDKAKNILSGITTKNIETGLSPLDEAQKNADHIELDKFYKQAESYYTRPSDGKIDTANLDNPRNKRTILWWAIACFQPGEVITSLISKGSAPEKEGYFDDNSVARSPVFSALAFDNVKALNSLLCYKPELSSVPDQFGASPAHYAATHNKVNMLAELFKFNNKIGHIHDIKTKLTPLHAAAKVGTMEAANWLLENDAKVCDFQDADGNTALHLAVTHNHPKIVIALLEHGANFNIQNSDQKTALQLAAESNNDQIVRLLMQDGARPDVEHPINIKILSKPVQIALSLLEYINERRSKPEHLALFGYGGYSRQQKIDVANKVITNVFSGKTNPLDDFSKEEMDILRNGETGQRAKELIQIHDPSGSNRVSPNNSPRTSPPSGNRSPA